MRLSTGEKLDDFGSDRTCGADECRARLSRYNPSEVCAAHAGWAEPPKRRGSGPK